MVDKWGSEEPEFPKATSSFPRKNAIMIDDEEENIENR
jgi:hypothetical protein